MSTLSPEHTKIVLAHLNSIAPDTFNEGDFSRWSFTSVRRKGAEWSVGFTNTGAADGDGVSFSFDGECVDEHGSVRSEWFEVLNTAVLEWESEMRGDGDWGDSGDE